MYNKQRKVTNSRADEKVGEAPQQDATQAEAAGPEGRPVPPLNISGVVITKAQLLEALRVYIPNIADFSPLQDGQHFYILFGQDSGSQ